jgi:hypothetical protein
LFRSRHWFTVPFVSVQLTIFGSGPRFEKQVHPESPIHESPIAHWFPHEPQFWLSYSTATHFPLHSSCFDQGTSLHAVHTPWIQSWFEGHLFPHEPQLSLSFVFRVTQPMPGQKVEDESQVCWRQKELLGS